MLLPCLIPASLEAPTFVFLSLFAFTFNFCYSCISCIPVSSLSTFLAEGGAQINRRIWTVLYHLQMLFACSHAILAITLRGNVFSLVIAFEKNCKVNKKHMPGVKLSKATEKKRV